MRKPDNSHKEKTRIKVVVHAHDTTRGEVIENLQAGSPRILDCTPTTSDAVLLISIQRADYPRPLDSNEPNESNDWQLYAGRLA
jgi:hypothetical protein